MLRIGFSIAIAVLACFFIAAVPSQAQVSVGIGIGAPPVCPYGYYGYSPYSCAPYGYYGPEWFTSGIFIGAGPWHHGPAFYGHINRAFDSRFGYRGPFPAPGEHWVRRDFHDFHGSHWSDGDGHYHTYAEHGRFEHRGR